jgi:hypothetical protein
MSSADSPFSLDASEPPAAGRGLLGWVATSNPLYVVSAGLFLYGLRESFGAQARDIDSWALMGGLAGYTLLLAAAALLLVRFAGVWNDVRTVLLLVVLMFLATSVTFDELLVLDPARGVLANLGGLVFSVVVSEGILRCIHLRLPAGFRVPYYLTLGLFFLYPVALTPVLREPHGEALLWGLFGFSPAAGLVFLMLLPAVRRGRGYVRGNGSPWPWPFYPWSLFVFLGAAVVGRSFLLCWSLHLLDGGTIEQLVFGPYFLVPFGFAVAVLLLELGIVGRHRGVMGVALALPAGLVVLAGIGHAADATYTEFLSLFAARLGSSPMFLAVCAAAAFYLVAWLRDVPLAGEALTAALTGLAFVGRETFALGDVRLAEPTMLLAPFFFQVGLALWLRELWRVIAVGGVAVVWGGQWLARGYLALRAEVAGLDYLTLGLLLFPVAVLVSLAKAGAIGRWVERWRRGTVR